MLDCLNAKVYGILHKARSVISLAGYNLLPDLIDDLALLLNQQELILIVPMTEPEKDCGNRSRLR